MNEMAERREHPLKDLYKLPQCMQWKVFEKVRPLSGKQAYLNGGHSQEHADAIELYQKFNIMRPGAIDIA